MKLPGPDHPITIAPHPKRLTVRFNGVVIAESQNALELREADYPAVAYIPRSDVSMERLLASDHSSHCPYKGDASYFSLAADGAHAENAVWSYQDPYPAMAEIKDHVAFYSDRVDAIEESDK
jgi:uncharacterized protein (DUF427 family)